jgi:hypothetical protein
MDEEQEPRYTLTVRLLSRESEAARYIGIRTSSGGSRSPRHPVPFTKVKSPV